MVGGSTKRVKDSRVGLKVARMKEAYSDRGKY